MEFNSHLQSINQTILYFGKMVDLIIVLVQGEMDVKKHYWKEIECTSSFLDVKKHYWKEIEVNEKSIIIHLFP